MYFVNIRSKIHIHRFNMSQNVNITNKLMSIQKKSKHFCLGKM